MMSKRTMTFCFSTCLIAMVAVSHIATAATVQYWRFDDNSGTSAANTIVTGNTGILNPGALGPTWITTGLEPSLTSRSFLPSTAALDFAPTNPDFVDGGNLNLSATNASGQATVSMWVRPDVLSADMRIFSQLSGAVSQGGATRTTTSGDLQVWSGAAWLSLAPSSTLTAGTWHHLAYVWTNDSVEAYVNGVAQLTATSDFDFGAGDGNFGIGARFLNVHGAGFNGAIDELAIFNTALSQAEITALANGAAAIAEPPPIPEPSTFSLLGLTTILLISRRRRLTSSPPAGVLTRRA